MTETVTSDVSGTTDVSASDSAPFDNALLDSLTEWMPRQRWFGGKTTTPALRIIGSF
ncbi:MAG: Maltokinase N-terminal cap domain, partial [Subtercola sp.]|nr:Maltokinase N-terminal cap domain [Subtercola sp.]